MIRINLSQSESEQLRQQARQEVGRVAERIHFVLLSEQGYSPPEIGALFDYHPATIRAWLQRYQRQGLAGLADQPRSGRPAKATAAFEAEVNHWMSFKPNSLDYLATFWTVALLLSQLLSQGWQVSTATLRRSLHRLEYRWRRPRLAVRRRDPAGSINIEAICQAVWRAKAEDHLFSVDESEFKLLPVLRAMWSKIAQTVHIPTPAYNASVWAYGAVDICTGQWVSALYDRFNATHFVAFLDKIVAACPTGQIIIILDHAPAHTAKKVSQWAATQPRVTILFLPKYASHLNPIERIWGVAKNKVVANHCYQTLAALRQAVQRYLDSVTPEAALQMTGLNL